MATPGLAFAAAHLARAVPRTSLPAARRQLPRLAAFSSARIASAQPTAKAQAAAAGAADSGSYVKGTVNDPTPFPTPNKAHGSIHWTFERTLSAALIPVTAATAVVSANPVLDGILGVALIVHSHLGFDQVLTDYLHDRKFPVLGPVMRWTVRALTVGTLVGVYTFNTHDIGLTELIKKLWRA